MREFKFSGKAVISIEELNNLGIEHEDGLVVGNLIWNNGNSPVICGDIVEHGSDYITHEWFVPVESKTVQEVSVFKFYEFYLPYYALIRAQNEEEAVNKYIEVVAGEEEDFEELMDELVEVDGDYALRELCKSYQSEREIDTEEFMNECIKTFLNKESDVLLMEKSLCW